MATFIITFDHDHRVQPFVFRPSTDCNQHGCFLDTSKDFLNSFHCSLILLFFYFLQEKRNCSFCQGVLSFPPELLPIANRIAGKFFQHGQRFLWYVQLIISLFSHPLKIFMLFKSMKNRSALPLRFSPVKSLRCSG